MELGRQILQILIELEALPEENKETRVRVLFQGIRLVRQLIMEEGGQGPLSQDIATTAGGSLLGYIIGLGEYDDKRLLAGLKIIAGLE